jgi:hypothetical protein
MGKMEAHTMARKTRKTRKTPRRDTWRDERWIADAAGHAVTVWSYKPADGERITAGTLFSGIAPGSVGYWADAIETYGHAITEISGSKPWAHNVIGCGVGHNDAEFCESGRSMAAYYESGEAYGGTWWEDSHARRYYVPAEDLETVR